MQTDTLAQHFTGTILRPGDAAYEKASKTFMGTGSPAIVLLPNTPQDVATAIAFAREYRLAIAIKSGGHSNAGLSSNDGGLVIDLAAMATIEVIDEARGTVRVGGGAVWGDVAKTLHNHGLAISSGDTKTVGVGGLTLGGGIGWMVRQYGLALDQLVAAEIVTAQGDIVRASTTENADLFWAIRGAGANFGVVTNFEFNAHPITDVYAGVISLEDINTGSIIAGWRDYMRTAPEELNTTMLVMPGWNGNPPGIQILTLYNGDDKVAADKAFAPLLALGIVTSNDITLKPYMDVLEEAHPPEGMLAIVNNALIADFNDDAVNAIDAHHAKDPNQIFMLRSLGGAMARVRVNATAFAHRDSEVLMVAPTFLHGGASQHEQETAVQWWDDFAPYTTGAYINFFSEATDKEVALAYPPATLERLTRIKRVYDPDNIFALNYNIKPSE